MWLPFSPALQWASQSEVDAVKMPEELEKAFNDQVTMELASANASYFSYENFEGDEPRIP